MAYASPVISVIIPCWRDAEEAVARSLPFVDHPAVAQIILAGVEGFEPTASLGKIIWCAVPRPSRGAQMNAGAAEAEAEILLFHHVDSEMTSSHLHAIIAKMRDTQVVGGGFYRAFDERHPGLRFLEKFERLHSRAFGTIYGDQSVFVRHEVFDKIGGFPQIPLMEDVAFSRRLRHAGKIALLDPPMKSSPARQMEEGAWRVTLRNLFFLIAFRLGVSPERLHAWYYRDVSMQLRPRSCRNAMEMSRIE